MGSTIAVFKQNIENKIIGELKYDSVQIQFENKRNFVVRGFKGNNDKDKFDLFVFVRQELKSSTMLINIDEFIFEMYGYDVYICRSVTYLNKEYSISEAVQLFNSQLIGEFNKLKDDQHIDYIDTNTLVIDSNNSIKLAVAITGKISQAIHLKQFINTLKDSSGNNKINDTLQASENNIHKLTPPEVLEYVQDYIQHDLQINRNRSQDIFIVGMLFFTKFLQAKAQFKYEKEILTIEYYYGEKIQNLEYKLKDQQFFHPLNRIQSFQELEQMLNLLSENKYLNLFQYKYFAFYFSIHKNYDCIFTQYYFFEIAFSILFGVLLAKYSTNTALTVLIFVNIIFPFTQILLVGFRVKIILLSHLKMFYYLYTGLALQNESDSFSIPVYLIFSTFILIWNQIDACFFQEIKVLMKERRIEKVLIVIRYVFVNPFVFFPIPFYIINLQTSAQMYTFQCITLIICVEIVNTMFRINSINIVVLRFFYLFLDIIIHFMVMNADGNDIQQSYTLMSYQASLYYIRCSTMFEILDRYKSGIQIYYQIYFIGHQLFCFLPINKNQNPPTSLTQFDYAIIYTKWISQFIVCILPKNINGKLILLFLISTWLVFYGLSCTNVNRYGGETPVRPSVAISVAYVVMGILGDMCIILILFPNILEN